MCASRSIAHVVHLYQHGVYLRTLPQSLSAPAAEQFVETYNRLGAPDGRSAATTIHEVELSVDVQLRDPGT